MSLRFRCFAKKSFSSLFALSDEQAISSPPSGEEPKHITIKNSEKLEEFGACSPGSSPSKDSLSRRRIRLMGSLRKLRASLEMTKAVENGERPVSPANMSSKDDCPRPSLALNFEVSRPGESLFYPEQTPSHSSDIEIFHSSPITVPQAAQATPSTIRMMSPPCQAPFVVGTVPESPAPLQRMSVQQAIIDHAQQSRRDTPVPEENHDPTYLSFESNPTPMPGTHLPLDVHTPSEENIRVLDTSNYQEKYFYIHPTKSLEATICHPQIDGAVEATPPNHQVEKTTVYTPNQHPLTPTRMTITRRSTNRKHHTSDPGSIQSYEGGPDIVSAYLALGGTDYALENIQCDLERNRSVWGRHTGLYDGSGYHFGDTACNTPLPPASDLTSPDDEPTEELEDDFPIESPRPRDEKFCIHNSVGNGSLNIVQTNDSVPTEGESMPGEHESVSEKEEPADDRETLQEIIRAYTISYPEVTEMSTNEEFAISQLDISHRQEKSSEEDFSASATIDQLRQSYYHHHQERSSEEDLAVYECYEDVVGDIGAEVIESVRIANRSLGG
ncbi:hypothetical protein B0J11DRAFT_516810 [Dendryphion nanum]|uniref:Uncharacterized protein n=1 Tax=Dendryphion nanum TaxID=256645 RepID=A0A9P9IZC6_9PLEO|nr:hypothetical protein B0J11DRAFT_516810 [Dendryphion nanum]